eukprot:gnl/Hemi2/24477_TR8233_c0_g1_i1.p1 gnl/Hemi2/24477_TR8233_c0_g1~~gnl/Hemi2/24477_TR8233_c0_g1_i1.p1  ORF type:complete len:214 (-),score=84.62 gnl/Hemi2/24477_TR8233_c0_g1_i1:177-818(-)
MGAAACNPARAAMPARNFDESSRLEWHKFFSVSEQWNNDEAVYWWRVRSLFNIMTFVFGAATVAVSSVGIALNLSVLKIVVTCLAMLKTIFDMIDAFMKFGVKADLHQRQSQFFRKLQRDCLLPTTTSIDIYKMLDMMDEDETKSKSQGTSEQQLSEKKDEAAAIAALTALIKQQQGGDGGGAAAPSDTASVSSDAAPQVVVVSPQAQPAATS